MVLRLTGGTRRPRGAWSWAAALRLASATLGAPTTATGTGNSGGDLFNNRLSGFGFEAGIVERRLHATVTHQH